MDAEREQFSAQLEKNISPNNTEPGGQHSKKSSYFCSHCDFPSDMIGLLDPCAHVFCLSCASQMSTCAMYDTLTAFGTIHCGFCFICNDYMQM